MSIKSRIIDVIGAVAIGAALVGCKTMPSVDTMYQCSLSVGVASGLVANQCKISDEARNGVIEVMGVVREVIPETNETFTAAWTPIAHAHVQKLIDAGKIDAAAGVAIMAAFQAAVIGIDYVFYRYPTAKQYQELTCAAIDGFCDGFLAVFKPVNGVVEAGRGSALVYDETSYRHVRAKMKK